MGTTGKVDINSPLIRKKWVLDNLLKEAPTSFWLPFTGTTSGSFVYLEKDESCTSGQNIIFDYSGELSGKLLRDNELVDGRGTGEIKRKFSSSLTMKDQNLEVNNGTKFDGCTIGDLSISQHSDSVKLLGSQYIRVSDQMKFDNAQGVFSPATHILVKEELTYNDIVDIESLSSATRAKLVKAGTKGEVTTTPAVKRAKLGTVQGKYMLLLDTYSANALKKDSKYQTLIASGDVRGMDNKVLTLALGKVGKLNIIETPEFEGSTPSVNGLLGSVNDSEVEVAGLRKYSVKGTDVFWQGTPEFDINYDLFLTGDTTVSIYSRNLLLGRDALQAGLGKSPDYKLYESKYGKETSSLLEVVTEVNKTVLTLESGQDYKGKVTGIDFGIIAIDIKHSL